MNDHVYTDLIHRSIDRHGNKACLHIKRSGAYRTWSYEDLHHDLNRCVSALEQAGFGPGCNGVVIGENVPEWVIAYHAMILAGGCTVPVDPNLPGQEVREIVLTTESRILFCTATHLPSALEFQEEFPFLSTVVVLDQPQEGSTPGFEQFLQGGDPSREAFSRAFAPEDPMVILFTSGTTGKAKGAVLMQKNFTAAGLHGGRIMQLDSSNTVLAILPLHHVFGFAACLAAPLVIGLDVVFVPKIKGPLILEALNDKHVSMLPAVPKMLAVLYENLQHKIRAKGPAVQALMASLRAISRTAGEALGTEFRRRLFKTVHEGFGGNLRVIISGGASLAPRYFDGFRLMGFDIVEGYGLTETFGPITLCPRDAPRQGSVGPALPENEIRIDNPNEEGIGEVLLRGTTIFAGYYKNEAATEAMLDKEGWLHTGDLGSLSKDGYLTLAGRSKDLIVLDSGKNVYPDELEDFYAVSEQIEEIGIFGARVKGQEIVAALIVPSQEIRKHHSIEKATEIIRNELIRLGANRPSYKKITDFAIVYQPLPRTTTRKLRKHELLELFYQLQKQPALAISTRTRLSVVEEALMRSERFQRLVACIRRIGKKVKDDRLTPQANLELDLDIDSLQKLDLFCALEEEFCITIPEEDLVRTETLGDVHGLISQMLEQSGSDGGPCEGSIRQRISSGAQRTLELHENRSGLFHTAPPALLGMSRGIWKTTIIGAENIPADRPLILAANHESMLDIVWLLGALPWEIRKRTFTIGKVELVRNPFGRVLLSRCNLIPVERSGDVVEALKASIAVVKSGMNLAIFPEGTRSRDGRMGPFKSGIGMLIQETNATILPTRLRGTFEIWSKGSVPRFFVRPPKEPSVRFGEPVTLQKLIDRGKLSAYSSASEIAEQIRKLVSAL
jgi:long-chain acyl-CoA synthetase